MSVEHCKYVDRNAALEVHGLFKKKLLQNDDIYECFVRPFEYGARREGYWSYKHLIIQLEDFVDVVKGIYGEKFEIQILVDH